MVAWYQGDDLKCSMCNSCIDSHKHLFFECVFSAKVWKEVKCKGRFIGNCAYLDNVVSFIADNGNKSNIWSIVNRLIVAASVYTLWSERNKRSFQNIRRTEEEIIALINKYMEDVLQTLSVKRSNAMMMVANRWNLVWEKGKLVPALLQQ